MLEWTANWTVLSSLADSLTGVVVELASFVKTGGNFFRVNKFNLVWTPIVFESNCSIQTQFATQNYILFFFCNNIYCSVHTCKMDTLYLAYLLLFRFRSPFFFFYLIRVNIYLILHMAVANVTIIKYRKHKSSTLQFINDKCDNGYLIDILGYRSRFQLFYRSLSLRIAATYITPSPTQPTSFATDITIQHVVYGRPPSKRWLIDNHRRRGYSV